MKRKKREFYEKRRKIPAEGDWGNFLHCLDCELAHQRFCGKSVEEVAPIFENPDVAYRSLTCMPAIPFQYYIFGFKNLLLSDRITQEEMRVTSADASQMIFYIVKEKLETSPKEIEPVMAELMPLLEYVAANQEKYRAEIDVFGSYATELRVIKELLQKDI